MTPTDSAIVFDDVSKSFDGHRAVSGLSFEVPPGSVYGLLGPNGAGKTTSIRLLMAIFAPDSGTIRVLGGSPTGALKDRIGYLPEERGLYRSMKVLDNLAFFGAMHGLSPVEARRRGADWLERLAMPETAERKLQELSKGNQQKIQFIATVLHEPDLLVLDEPFSGLDPVNQDLVRGTILDLTSRGTTVMLSTHLMDEVERICTRISLVHRGRAIVEGDLDEVKRRYGRDLVRVDFRGGDPAFVSTLPGVAEVTRIGNSLEIRLDGSTDPSALLADVAGRIPVHGFEVHVPSLHGIFVRLVGGSEEEEAPAAAPVGSAP